MGNSLRSSCKTHFIIRVKFLRKTISYVHENIIKGVYFKHLNLLGFRVIIFIPTYVIDIKKMTKM